MHQALATVFFRSEFNVQVQCRRQHMKSLYHYTYIVITVRIQSHSSTTQALFTQFSWIAANDSERCTFLAESKTYCHLPNYRANTWESRACGVLFIFRFDPDSWALRLYVPSALHISLYVDKYIFGIRFIFFSVRRRCNRYWIIQYVIAAICNVCINLDVILS